jgi:hypothetical protein
MSIFANSFKPKMNLGLESLDTDLNQEETAIQTEPTVVEQVEETPVVQTEETPAQDDTGTEDDGVVDVTDPVTGEPIGEPVTDPSTDTEENPIVNPEAPAPFVAEEDSSEVIIDTDTGEVVDEEVLEDPIEDEDDETEEERELDQLLGEEFAIENLFNEIHTLSNASVAVENFGVSPSSIAIMQITGLLSSTALEHVGCESFADATKIEADLAVESLGEKIKEKSAAMSAKVLKVFKDTGEKISGVIKPLWNKATALVGKVTSKVWDASKVAGAKIKAHPYATVVAVIGAIAAVAGIIAFVGGNMPVAGAKGEAIASFNKRVSDMINGIKWPFGKVSASVDGGKLKAVVEGGLGSATTDSVEKLKWSQTAVKSISGQLDRALKAVQGAGDHFSERGSKIAKSVADFSKDVGSAYTSTNEATNNHLSSIARANMEKGQSLGRSFASPLVAAGGIMVVTTALTIGIWKLIKFIVLGGLKIILGTFRALASLVTGNAKTEEATA